LGLTLYLLTRAEAQPAAAAPPRSLWLLPPLFALWVNLDAWFFLGPLCVGLWLLGACLQPGMRRGPLARVLAVGLLACLLNPYHVRAFPLPVELAYMVVSVTGPLDSPVVAAGSTALRVQHFDPGFLNLPSPFSHDYLGYDARGRNVAGLAYFLLLLLGVASFVLPAVLRPAGVPPRLHRPRLLLWLVFAFFGVLQARLVPFFAV